MRTIFLFLLVFVTGFVSGQVSAPGSSALRYTSYLSGPPNSPVFIFCSSTSTDPSLQATSPGGTGPFTFDWYSWNNTDKAFNQYIKTDADVYISDAANLSEGGYMVRITDISGYDSSLVAWVYTDTPLSEISLQQSLCNQVTLRGRAFADDFYYDDIVTGQQILLPNDVAFRYSSTPASLIPNPTVHTYDLGDYGLKILNTPPLEDLTYMLEVTDSMGCISESSFFYESIHVNASFEVNPDRGEAPLEVLFTDNSVRAYYYTWRFGDDTISNSPDPGSHTYYKPGEYTVRLTVESDKGCIDSTSFEKIVVEPSSLDIPNVFTPDGDGINEFFLVESKSLRYLYVQIFSESGYRVYQFEGKGDALAEWQGWDGKIGSGMANPGVYFYIIKASGWDNITYDGKEYRGFLHLYR